MAPRSCLECRSMKVSCSWLKTVEDAVCTTCARRGVACSGPPPTAIVGEKKRRRKNNEVINAIRAISSSSSSSSEGDSPLAAPPMGLSAMAPASRLATFEMAAALQYHLLLSAAVAASRAPPTTSLGRIAHDLNESGLPAPRLNLPAAQRFSEEFLANWREVSALKPGEGRAENLQTLAFTSFLAVGARESRHSSILGAGENSLHNVANIGERRELPTYALVDRAIASAEALGIFEPSNADISHTDMIDLLIHIIMHCAPEHPAGRRCIQALHDKRQFIRSGPPNVSTVSIAWVNMTEPEQDFLSYDSAIALRARLPSLFTDDELETMNTWCSRKNAETALATLAQLTLQPWEGAIGLLWTSLTQSRVRLQRCIISLRQTGLALPLPSILDSISDIINMSETIQSFFEVKRPQILADPNVLADGWLPLAHAQQTPMLITFSYACETVRYIWIYLATTAAEDGVFEALSSRVDQLFVRALKFTLLSDTLDDPAASLHDLAATLGQLASDYDFVSVAVSAAQQTTLGEGPLASTGFSEADLSRFRLALRQCGTIFGNVGRNSASLELSLANLSLSEKRGDGLHEIAETLVQNALETL